MVRFKKGDYIVVTIGGEFHTELKSNTIYLQDRDSGYVATYLPHKHRVWTSCIYYSSSSWRYASKKEIEGFKLRNCSYNITTLTNTPMYSIW